MSALDSVFDTIKGRFHEVGSAIRVRVFGANNEQLDFFLDSFYKLSPPQRSAVFAGIVVIISGFVFAALVLYVNRVDTLKQELNDSFAALHEIQALKSNYKAENARFSELSRKVGDRVKSLRLLPFLEAKARAIGVTMSPETPQHTELLDENPLSEKIKETNININFRKISIPKLLRYVVEIEKDGSYFRVLDLKVSGIYGTKLYFNSTVKFRAYSVK